MSTQQLSTSYITFISINSHLWMYFEWIEENSDSPKTKKILQISIIQGTGSEWQSVGAGLRIWSRLSRTRPQLGVMKMTCLICYQSPTTAGSQCWITISRLWPTAIVTPSIRDGSNVGGGNLGMVSQISATAIWSEAWGRGRGRSWG